MKPGQELRTCLTCGKTSAMETYLSSTNTGQFIAIVLFIFILIPGLIYIAIMSGKYVCPACGAVGKNKPFERQKLGTPADQLKRCPHCAEIIQRAAKICKHCGNQVVNVLPPPPDQTRPLPD